MFKSDIERYNYAKCCDRLKLGSEIDVYINNTVLSRDITPHTERVKVIARLDKNYITIGSKTKKVNMYMSSSLSESYYGDRWNERIADYLDYRYIYFFYNVRGASEARIARIH
jgi:hypothetical protein